jgi:indole-3-glycerol phosphate synthase
MTILDTIIAEKRKHVAECKKLVPLGQFEKHPYFNRFPISLKSRLTTINSSGIIAEFKRHSPSKGTINDKVLPEMITRAYQDAGVAGVSILTDTPFFGGTSEDLIQSRNLLSIPILRKDFIIDEYQLYEAKAMGADVILLIASVLEQAEIKRLASIARNLRMEVLFEVHDLQELDKVCPEVTFVGVNNRNLKTFQVNIQQSLDLVQHIPKDFPAISESGIDNPDTIKTLRTAGFKGFLIGENFMKSENPGLTCQEFIKLIK